MDLRALCIDRVWLQKQFRRPRRVSLRSWTRPAAPQVRPLNRGARAWESDAESVWLQCRHPEVPGVVTRSNVHAVTDDTSAFYVKIVCKALDAIVAGIRDGRWPPPTGIFDLDGILRAIVDNIVYKQNLHSSVGLKFHAAWNHTSSICLTNSRCSAAASSARRTSSLRERDSAYQNAGGAR